MPRFCFDFLVRQEMHSHMSAGQHVPTRRVRQKTSGPAISGGTTAVDVPGTPCVSEAMHSCSVTADNIGNSLLEAVTRSPLTAHCTETSSFAICSNFMGRFHVPNALTVSYLEPCIMSDHRTDRHATRNSSKQTQKTIVKMAKNEAELTKRDREQADHCPEQTTRAATAGGTEEESAPRAEKSRPSQQKSRAPPHAPRACTLSNHALAIAARKNGYLAVTMRPTPFWEPANKRKNSPSKQD